MDENESFINSTYVTYSSMAELIKQLKREEEVLELCKKNGISLDFLGSMLNLMMKGFNNKEVAEKLGVHRVTIQRYAYTLRQLKESEFQKLKEYIFNLQDERKN